LLDDHRVNPGADGNFALISAVRDGDVQILKLLLAHRRTDPTERDNEAFIFLKIVLLGIFSDFDALGLCVVHSVV
jgi:hypothetical protein